jgi:hypothetical protein
LDRQFLDRSVGMMRAIVKRVDMGAFALQDCLHVRIE